MENFKSVFKDVFNNKKFKTILIIAVFVFAFLIIITAAWKEELFKLSQNDGDTKKNTPAAAETITKKVVARRGALAGSGTSTSEISGSNGSMVEAARSLIELTKLGGSEEVYYGEPRTSSSGFTSSCYVCASFAGEVLYNATNGAVNASGLDGVNSLGEFLLTNSQCELIYYYPYATSIPDISGAVNTDKKVEDIIQPGDIVATYSSSYTFQHVMVYIGNNEFANQGGNSSCPSIDRRGFSDVKYIFRLKGQGSTITSSDVQVADLNKIDSYIKVLANGTSATVTLEEKSGNTWKTVLTTSGYVGRSGVGKGSENDAKTPAGAYTLGIGFGVHTDNPGTALTWKKITSSNWVWVDDPSSKYYNKLIDTNSVGYQKGEVLVNIGNAYKYAIAINYNTNPIVPGAGSAIFLHCIGSGPTAGCVAVPQSDMITILKKVKKSTMIVIGTQSGEYAIDKYIRD